MTVLAAVQMAASAYFLISRGGLKYLLALLVLFRIKIEDNPFIVETSLEQRRKWRQMQTDLLLLAAILSV